MKCMLYLFLIHTGVFFEFDFARTFSQFHPLRSDKLSSYLPVSRFLCVPWIGVNNSHILHPQVCRAPVVRTRWEPAAKWHRAVSSGRYKGNGGDGGEYMGPVFEIRQLDKDAEPYGSFITTGVAYKMCGRPRPSKATGSVDQQEYNRLTADEDSEYFSVSVRQVRVPKEVHVNVSLSSLLNAMADGWRRFATVAAAGHPIACATTAAAGRTGRSRGRGISPRYRNADGITVWKAIDGDPSEHELLFTMCYNFAREYYYFRLHRRGRLRGCGRLFRGTDPAATIGRRTARPHHAHQSLRSVFLVAAKRPPDSVTEGTPQKFRYRRPPPTAVTTTIIGEIILHKHLLRGYKYKYMYNTVSKNSHFWRWFF